MNIDILLCFIAHKCKSFLSGKLFSLFLAPALALADDLTVEAHLYDETLIVVRTFLADKDVFHLFLRILLHYPEGPSCGR